MEKEKISRFRGRIGPKLIRWEDSYAIGFRFYWFALFFFKRWYPNIYRDGAPCMWTGFVFSYRPNRNVGWGDLIWAKEKKWMWPDYPKEMRHAP